MVDTLTKTSAFPLNIFTIKVPVADAALIKAMAKRMGWSIEIAIPQQAEAETEPVITSDDLVIDPVVARLFANVPPLPKDFDEKEAYGNFLMEKYK